MVPFLQYRIIYVLISCAVIVAGLFSVVRWGYTYSIDFIGGSVLDYQLKGVDEKQVSVIQSILTQQKITAERLEFKQQILSLRAKILMNSRRFGCVRRLHQHSRLSRSS